MSQSSLFDMEPVRQYLIPQKAPFVTLTLIVINTLLFIGMCIATKGEAFMNPTVPVLLKWGANWAPLTLSDQPWRALTACFAHIGALHLLMNMSVLWLMGRICEPLYGHFRYLFLYLAAGIGGFLFSLLFNPEVPAAGASGAILGLMGGHLAFVYTRREEIGSDAWKNTLKTFLGYLIVCTIYGFTVHADHAGHFGGAATGFLFGTVLAPLEKGKGSALSDSLVLLVLTGSLVGFYFAQKTGIADWTGKVLWMQAVNQEEKGNFKEAIDLWERQLSRTGPNEAAYKGLLRNCWRTGKFNKALESANGLIKLNGATAKNLHTRASVNARLGDSRAVIDDETRVLKLQPDNVAARLLRANSLIKLREFDKALSDLRLVTSKKTDNVEVLKMIAGTDLILERYKEAERSARLALSKDEKDKGSRFLLASIYKDSSQFDRALEQIEILKSQGADHSSIAQSKASIYAMKGDTDQAIEILESSLAKHPESFQLLFSLTHKYLKIGNYERSIECAQKAIQLPGAGYENRSYLALMHYVAASKIAPSNKLKLVKTCLETPNAGDSFARLLLQYLDGRVTDKELAAQSRTRADKTEAHFYIGIKLLRAGKKEEAERHLRWVLDNGIRSFVETDLAGSLIRHP